MVSRQRGFVLVTTLVLGVALTLLAHAALMLGTASERASIRELDRVGAVMRARADLVAALAAVRTSTPPPAGVRIDRLGRELLLLRSGTGVAGRAGLVWVGDPLARVEAIRAGVEVDAVPALADVGRIVGAGPSGICVGGVVEPVRPRWIASAGPEPLRFGPLEAEELQGVLPALGSRLEAPAAPGAGYAASDLTVAGRVGPVGLWVEGDVRLAPGAEVVGYVRATGRMIVGAGARFTGVVRAGGIALDASAEVHVRPCALAEVLAAHPQLIGPRALRPFGWPTDH
jgi:hypothetical protein